jgi:hypothetical protein
VDAHAVFLGQRRARTIDPHPQHHPGRFAAELNVENLQSVAAGHAFGDGPHLLDDGFRAHLPPISGSGRTKTPLN